MVRFVFFTIIAFSIRKIIQILQPSHNEENHLQKKYTQLQYRYTALDWSEGMGETTLTEDNLELLEQKIEEQEQMYKRYKRVYFQAHTMGWEIPKRQMPMNDEQVQKIESEFHFSLQWHPLLIKSYKTLPFFLRRSLPTYPYREEEIVRFLLFIRNKNLVWNTYIVLFRFFACVSTIVLTILLFLP